MAGEVVVDLVNLDKRFCVTEQGGVFPITQLYDISGYETDVVRDAVSAVAGAGANWFAFSLQGFREPKLDS